MKYYRLDSTGEILRLTKSWGARKPNISCPEQKLTLQVPDLTGINDSKATNRSSKTNPQARLTYQSKEDCLRWRLVLNPKIKPTIRTPDPAKNHLI